MKYIRTKDGRIVTCGTEEDSGYSKGYIRIQNKPKICASADPIEILKEADTIEELCKEVTKQPYYLKDTGGTISETDDTDRTALYSFGKNAIVLIYYGECSFVLKINEYGKTWALAKEELQ